MFFLDFRRSDFRRSDPSPIPWFLGDYYNSWRRVTVTQSDHLGQAISDNNNRMIALFKLPFQLNEASFRKRDLLKLPKLIIWLIKLSVNPLSRARCVITFKFWLWSWLWCFRLPADLSESDFSAGSGFRRFDLTRTRRIFIGSGPSSNHRRSSLGLLMIIQINNLYTV